MNIKLEEINQELLKFDRDNMRYFHLDGYDPEESLLIVAKSSVQKIVNSIISKGFDYIHYLHVNKKNIVRDGNSRLLACRIVLGDLSIKKLVKKYKINGFNKLDSKEFKVPILRYENDDDLTRYVMDEHLTMEKEVWTAAARYTFWYKQYIDKKNIEFPNDILIKAKSVQLFLDAIQFANNKEDKDLYERSYEARVTTFLRAFQNIRLIHNSKKTNLANLMKFHFNEEMEFKYNENIYEHQYKEILLEIANYVSNHGVGAKIKSLDDKLFSKTYNIINNIFNINNLKEPEEIKKEDSQQKKDNKKAKEINNKTIKMSVKPIASDNSGEYSENMFPLYFNLSITTNQLSNYKNNKWINGWWQRILIENSIWTLASISLKRKLEYEDFEFLYNLEHTDEKIPENFKELFKFVKSNLNTIEATNIANLLNEFNKVFKYDDKNGNSSFFTKNEQKFIKFIKTNALNYIDNLNQAAHGRWRDFDADLLQEKNIKEILNMIKDWEI